MKERKNTMKELLERLKEAERKADAADREYENDPENEEKEGF